MKQPPRIYILLALVALIFSSSFCKLFTAYYIEGIFENRGITHAELYVDNVGLHEAELRDLSIGDSQSPMEVLEAHLYYSPTVLWTGRIDNLEIDHMTLNAEMTNRGMQFYGLNPFIEDLLGESASYLPQSILFPEFYPIRRFSIKHGLLKISFDGIHITLPFAMTYDGKKLKFTSKGLKGTWETAAFESRAITAEMNLNRTQNRWQGSWSIEGLSTNALRLESATRAMGTLSVSPNSVNIPISLQSENGQTQAQLRYDADIDGAALTARQFTIALDSGRLSLSPVSLPLHRQGPVLFNLSLDHIPLEKLLALFIDNSAKAQGSVSGDVPLSLNVDNTLLFYPATLSADKPGRVSLPPTAIADNNENADKLRKLLASYHFNSLALDLQSGVGDDLHLQLNATGANPDLAAKGQPKFIGVTLNSDMNSLLKQFPKTGIPHQPQHSQKRITPKDSAK